MIKIAFAGNPNVGKSAIINAMAGSKLKVGNWPGVTVEKKEAFFTYNKQEINMIDLPGVYSLSPYTIEEKVTREYILTEKPDVIINVLDSTNLERNLYLTELLKEFGVPMIIALNFNDEFEKLGYKLDVEKFEKLIGVPVVKTSAIKNTGIKILLDRALEIKNNTQIKKEIKTDSKEIYKDIKNILEQVLITSDKMRLDFTDKVDNILLNKYLGLPLFLGVMGLLMTVVFNGSAPLVDMLDKFINETIVGAITNFMIGTPDWLSSLVTSGIIGGLGGIVVFVPLMLFLYFFLSILEESGYMTRVAFLMDKIMRGLGLNGKAFVPMIIGFGCSVPAIYATRTLEDIKSRKLTAIMTPFMSCGARLPVYGLFTAAFFGAQAGIIIMSLYLMGIVAAIIVGIILKRFENFKSDEKALILELPPYRIPSIKVVINSTLNRTGEYLKKASTTILAVLMILWALTYFPAHGDTSKSYMASFGKVIAPAFEPTGFGNRWETVAAILPSIAAKEIVVGFLGQVLNSESEETTHKLDNHKTGVVLATSTLWENDPLGKLRAYSFMVFILLVVPCVVALAAIKHEFGLKFMGFVIFVMIITPYIFSTIIFQVGRLFL